MFNVIKIPCPKCGVVLNVNKNDLRRSYVLNFNSNIIEKGYLMLCIIGERIRNAIKNNALMRSFISVQTITNNYIIEVNKLQCNYCKCTMTIKRWDDIKIQIDNMIKALKIYKKKVKIKL